eukprot:g17236.t1
MNVFDRLARREADNSLALGKPAANLPLRVAAFAEMTEGRGFRTPKRLPNPAREGSNIRGVRFFELTLPQGETLQSAPFNVTAGNIGMVFTDMGSAVIDTFNGELVDPDQLSVCFAIEDVAMQHRSGQNPASSLKLTHAFCTLAAAATVFRSECARTPDASDILIDFPRPQAWQAFYALGMSGEPIKQASVAMAKRVMEDINGLPLSSEVFAEMATDLSGLNNHNCADSFLIAMRDVFMRLYGWTFYKPLADGAS